MPALKANGPFCALSDRMAEAVVDELKVVDVQEQHGITDRRITLMPGEGVPEAVHEQGSVGKPREGVVERIVL
jgi:hypothetical protein